MRYNDYLDLSALRRYANALNHRAQTARINGAIGAETLRGIILDSGGRCEWCGKSIVDREFEIDHVISVRAGGANSRHNLAVACPSCNHQKSDRHPAVFAAWVVAQSGQRTALVERVLAEYDGEALYQRSLFDDEPAPTPSPDDDDIPPYRWGQRD